MATVDVQSDSDGEITTSGGDFTVASAEQSELQEVIFRLRTETMGYLVDLDLPAGLDLFIGKPNRPSLGIQIEEAVKRCLTYDGLYSSGDLKVDAIPLSKSVIGVYLFVTSKAGGNVVTTSFTINLISGTISLITD